MSASKLTYEMDENNVESECAGLDCEMCECIHGNKAPAYEALI